jgi:hypothetical protein
LADWVRGKRGQPGSPERLAGPKVTTFVAEVNENHRAGHCLEGILDLQEEKKVMVAEQGVVHVENIETGESVMTRTFLAHWVVHMEVRKVAEEAQGPTWNREAQGRTLEQTGLVECYVERYKEAVVAVGDRKTGDRFVAEIQKYSSQHVKGPNHS